VKVKENTMEYSNIALTITFALMVVLAIVAKCAADWADRQNGLY
jgi:hypothetical protein